LPGSFEISFSEKNILGDNRARKVCDTCGFIDYVNPKIVVGTVSTWAEKFLLVKRAIEPRKGFWTIPAGYLEVGETTEAGAVRETWEEARALTRIRGMVGLYNILRISEVYLIYSAEMLSPKFSPGIECLDAGLFSWEEIPWDSLAFPSVSWALSDYKETMGKLRVMPKSEPPFIHWER